MLIEQVPRIGRFEHVAEAVTHAAVLAELQEPRTREVAEELTEMVVRYLLP